MLEQKRKFDSQIRMIFTNKIFYVFEKKKNFDT